MPPILQEKATPKRDALGHDVCSVLANVCASTAVTKTDAGTLLKNDELITDVTINIASSLKKKIKVRQNINLCMSVS